MSWYLQCDREKPRKKLARRLCEGYATSHPLKHGPPPPHQQMTLVRSLSTSERDIQREIKGEKER